MLEKLNAAETTRFFLLYDFLETSKDPFRCLSSVCFSVHSWSFWICTSSAPSLAPAAANPHLKAYRRHSALPQGNHRTATLPTKHKHLFMSSHPHRLKKKTHILTLSCRSKLLTFTCMLALTHRYIRSSYISCPTARWELWCRREECCSSPNYRWGSSTLISDWTELLNLD